MKKKRIFIVGDSTACIYPHCGASNRFPRTGWGQVVDRFLPEYHIIDLALSGRSSKSFKTEENFEFLKNNISIGDCLIIQFAHNDSKKNDPSRYTSPNGEYQSSLMEYVRIARSKGAAPILATPISRNKFSDPSLEKYVNAVMQLSQEQVIPLMDFYTKLSTYINQSGCAAAANMFMNVQRRDPRFMDDPRYADSEYYDKYTLDNTHLNINGALYIAELAANMIHELLKY